MDEDAGRRGATTETVRLAKALLEYAPHLDLPEQTTVVED
jgi:hypothetical protein